MAKYSSTGRIKIGGTTRLCAKINRKCARKYFLMMAFVSEKIDLNNSSSIRWFPAQKQIKNIKSNSVILDFVFWEN